MTKIIENFIDCAKSGKELNEFISKIICAYMLKTFSKEELEEMANISEREGVEGLLYALTCAVDDCPLDEALNELYSDKELEGVWRV